jgi:hypothetical protein
MTPRARGGRQPRTSERSSRRHPQRQRHTRLVPLPRRITRTGTARANSVTFTGKIGGHTSSAPVSTS